MQLSSDSICHNRVRGIFDCYPIAQGEMIVWVVSEDGRRIRFVDRFEPKVYVSWQQDELERFS